MWRAGRAEGEGTRKDLSRIHALLLRIHACCGIPCYALPHSSCPAAGSGADLTEAALRGNIVLGCISGPPFSCRDPRPALNCSYRSDSVTRECPVALRVRGAQTKTRFGQYKGVPEYLSRYGIR